MSGECDECGRHTLECIRKGKIFYMNIDNLPPKLKFCYIAMTKSAIYFKEMDQNKQFFLNFCDEIWNSMELSDLKEIKDTLDRKMEKDIKPYVQSYIEEKFRKGKK